MWKKSQRCNPKSVNKADLEPNHSPFSQIALLGGLLVIVCVVTAAAHWPALSSKAQFIDDNRYLTENELVQNPGWTSAGRFLSEILRPSTIRGYYQPLAMISLMLDYAMGAREDNLTLFRLTSLALHLANTALIIVFLYQLFGHPWPAVLVGLLFGVHPLTIESIPWLSERKTLLAAFFALWCLILYVRFTRTGNRKTYLLCMTSLVLALMSKPTSTPLPLLMLLLNYWPLRQLSKKAVAWTVPFFVVSGIAAVVTFVSQSNTADIATPGAYSPMQLLLIICHNIIFYLYKCIWPVQLSARYPVPIPFTLNHPMLLAGVIGTCVLIPALLISLRWTRALLTGWLFFFVAVFPTMGTVGFTDVIAADRFVYFPAIGILMVLAWLLTRFCPASPNILSRRYILALVPVLLIAAAEITATRRYLVHWSDTVSLYRYTLTISPRDAKLHDNLGSVLAQKRLLDEALTHFVKAVRLNPKNPNAHYNLGLVLIQKGETEGAITHLRISLQLDPDCPYTLTHLAWILATSKELQFRDSDEAVRLAERACELTNYRDPEMLNVLRVAQRAAVLQKQSK